MVRHKRGARARIAVALTALAVSGLATLAAAGPATAAPVGCGDAFYLATANTITQRASNGTLTPTSTGTFDSWTLALNPIDGNLYALPNAQATGNHIWRIEADGSAADLGEVTGLPGNALYSLGGFDDAGTLWTANSTALYGIDIATMTATSVALGTSLLGDFAYVDGMLYSLTGSPLAPQLARVDPATGAVVAVAVPGMINGTSLMTVAGHVYVSQGTSIAEVLGYGTATPTLLTVATGLSSVPRDGASCPTGPSPFLNAADDDYSATPLTVPAGGSVGIVFGNDTRNGSTVVAADIAVTVVDDGGLAGAAVAPDGTLTVPAGTGAGTYSIEYRICAVATPSLCDTALATVSLVAPGPTTSPAAAPTLPPTGAEAGGVAVAVAVAALLLAAGLVLIRRRPRPAS